MHAIDDFSPEERILVDESMQDLDARYDSHACLVRADRNGRAAHDVRSSAHYALGLLIRGENEDICRADQVIHAVLSNQYNCPGEIYHGTFRRTPQEPHPPREAYPWQEVSLLDRYLGDVAWERIKNTFHRRLSGNETLKPYATLIESYLSDALPANYPVLWKSFDPNWREFILTTFALILSGFEEVLPILTVQRILEAAKRGLEGALERSHSGFAPMNTNIELMHIFVSDFFGQRLNDQEMVMYASKYAESFYREYMEFHSVREYNSPTYYGVDLVTLSCWCKYAPSPKIRQLGKSLEAALWEDVADMYNHSLRNMSGPYSRNYEMDMSRHSSLHALMFAGLGMARFPEKPFNTENSHNLLIAIGGVRIPETVQARLLRTGGERSVMKRFRELSERGRPGDNASLCTASAWISDSLMIGGLSGSRNVSGQLHPATVFWRDLSGGVSSMRLQRSYTNGSIEGFHTAVFDCVADKNRLSIEVSILTNRDVKVYFEFQSPGIHQASISESLWEISGLQVHIGASAPNLNVEKSDSFLRVCYLSSDDQPESKKMHFDMEFKI